MIIFKKFKSKQECLNYVKDFDNCITFFEEYPDYICVLKKDNGKVVFDDKEVIDWLNEFVPGVNLDWLVDNLYYKPLWFFKRFQNSFISIFTWWKVIWKWRWWDFSFFYDIVEFQLEQWVKHFGIDSHFVGDKFTQKRAIVLLNKLRELKRFEDEMRTKDDVVKYKQMRDEFFKLLGKNIERFWD